MNIGRKDTVGSKVAIAMPSKLSLALKLSSYALFWGLGGA
jgi:hypothetical protein